MPIMWGLAIGAAMGGGIAALRGGKPEDILKGAAIGGATGAVGGGISSLMPAATGGVAAGAANVAPAASTALAEGVTSTAISPALAAQAPSMTSMFPNAAAPLSGVTSSAPTIANTALNQGIAAPASTGTEFFESGIGKTLADNKGMLGMGALGLMALKPQGSGGSAPEQEGYIRPYTYNQKNQTYSAQAPVKSTDWGTRSVAEGGVIRMAEGGDPEVATTEQQRENRTNPTLEALAVMQQAQQAYQPPQQSMPQGITQPLIQPQMAEVQQRYTTPQRTVPADFQYQAPQFVSYGIGGGGSGGSGGGYGSLVDPTTGKPIAGAKPGTPGGGSTKPGNTSGNTASAAPYMAGASAPYDPKNPTSIMPDTGNFRAPVPITSLNPAGVVGYDYNPLKSEEISRAQIYYGTSPGESDRYTVPISPYANTGYGTVGMGDGAGYSGGLGYTGVELDPGYNNLKTPTSSENLAKIYQGMLGRAPDASGIASFANMAPDQVVSAIIASPEYQATNGPAPEPTYYYGGQEMYTPQYAQVRPDAYYDSNAMMGGGDADGGLIADKHPKYAMGGGVGDYYASPDDGNRNFDGISGLNQGPQYPMQGVAHADGGVMSYAMGGQLGGYSDGGQLLRGPGDGVSDDIPAQIGNRQPARLADGEFVIPARIVSELGNGSTDAGAKRLYAMMERIQKNRGKTVGKGKVAVNSKSNKYLPA